MVGKIGRKNVAQLVQLTTDLPHCSRRGRMRLPGASERPLGSPIRDAAVNGEMHSYSNEANHPTLPHKPTSIPLSLPRLPTIAVRAAKSLTPLAAIYGQSSALLCPLKSRRGNQTIFSGSDSISESLRIECSEAVILASSLTTLPRGMLRSITRYRAILKREFRSQYPLFPLNVESLNLRVSRCRPVAWFDPSGHPSAKFLHSNGTHR